MSTFPFISVAGTAGAVVTCPLEVVKTRLQSSNAFAPINSARTSHISETTAAQNSSFTTLRRPEQRRKFSSTILRRVRPQVIILIIPIICLILTLLSCAFCPHVKSCINIFLFLLPLQKTPMKSFCKSYVDKIRLKFNVNPNCSIIKLNKTLINIFNSVGKIIWKKIENLKVLT